MTHDPTTFTDDGRIYVSTEPFPWGMFTLSQPTDTAPNFIPLTLAEYHHQPYRNPTLDLVA